MFYVGWGVLCHHDKSWCYQNKKRYEANPVTSQFMVLPEQKSDMKQIR